MEIKIETRESVKTIETKEMDFPYIGWWCSKKESIVKLYPEYYEHDKTLLRAIVVIVIEFGWNTPTYIKKSEIGAHNGVVGEKLDIYVRDYYVEATEEDFNEFKNRAFEDIK